jgi:hypothetical protein
MSAEPRDLTPDLVRLRRGFEEQKRRAQKSGDRASTEWLDELERMAQDPEFWAHPPSVLAQLRDHLDRLDIKP